MGIRSSFNPLGCLPKVPMITWTVTNIVQYNDSFVLPSTWVVNGATISNENCVIVNAVQDANEETYTVTVGYMYGVLDTIDSSNLTVTFTDNNFYVPNN